MSKIGQYWPSNFFSSIVLIKTITGKNTKTYLCLPSEIIIFIIFPIMKPLLCAKIFYPIIDPQSTTVLGNICFLSFFPLLSYVIMAQRKQISIELIATVDHEVKDGGQKMFADSPGPGCIE